MSEEATAVLADFAASLTYEAIPERVRGYCKDLLLDALACAVAGHAGEETHQLAALSSALAQSRESTVIGGDRLSLAGPPCSMAISSPPSRCVTPTGRR